MKFRYRVHFLVEVFRFVFRRGRGVSWLVRLSWLVFAIFNLFRREP